MVIVAVCAATSVRLYGVMLQVDTAGTPFPQASETAPVNPSSGVSVRVDDADAPEGTVRVVCPLVKTKSGELTMTVAVDVVALKLASPEKLAVIRLVPEGSVVRRLNPP